jgi:hypothetical protein
LIVGCDSRSDAVTGTDRKPSLANSLVRLSRKVRGRLEASVTATICDEIPGARTSRASDWPSMAAALSSGRRGRSAISLANCVVVAVGADRTRLRTMNVPTWSWKT